MKIKIIDLLNKIANGEEVPEKIKYKNEIYERYQNISTNNLYYYQVPNKCKFLIDQLSSVIDLLDEVEIIEEPKKIEYPILHKTAPSETTGDQMPNWRNLIDCNFEYLNKTICQLIDKINNLKEND